jgi:hypothetical protein
MLFKITNILLLLILTFFLIQLIKTKEGFDVVKAAKKTARTLKKTAKTVKKTANDIKKVTKSVKAIPKCIKNVVEPIKDFLKLISLFFINLPRCLPFYIIEGIGQIVSTYTCGSIIIFIFKVALILFIWPFILLYFIAYIIWLPTQIPYLGKYIGSSALKDIFDLLYKTLFSPNCSLKQTIDDFTNIMKSFKEGTNLAKGCKIKKKKKRVVCPEDIPVNETWR